MPRCRPLFAPLALLAAVLACGDAELPAADPDGPPPVLRDAAPDSGTAGDLRLADKGADAVAPGDRPSPHGDGPAPRGDAAPILPPGQPNIVFIMLDDAGSADYGNAPYTDASITQPNMKQLAGQSMRFEQYYTAPMCTPTRMSQLTGQYPMSYGILWVCGSNAEYGIPAGHATLPQALTAAGYHTATFGKWHSGQGKEAYEAHKKFDRAVVSFGPVANGYFDPRYTVDGGGTPVEHKGAHLTDVTADYVVQHIQNRAKLNKPFFVNYWLNAPHSPHEPSPRWEQKYCGTKTGTACSSVLRYKALLSQADEAIGKVLAAIDAIPGLSEKTIVLLTSDNGGTALTHPNGNGPLRGFKSDVFEGGTRLPLYVRWPKVVTPGVVDRSLIGVQDIFPTFAELAGAPAPKGIAGKSFAKVILGQQRNRDRGEPMYWSHKVANEHVSTTTGNVLVSYAVREGPWKLVYEPLDRAAPYLFDIGAKASEADANDLSAAHPARVKDLEQKYLTWLLASSRVPATVASTDGAVSVSGGTLTFGAAGGWAALAQHQAFNVTRLDFTFAARIKATAKGTLRTIASQAGGWALRINAEDLLELRATGATGQVSLLVGKTPLAVNKTYDVAFTIYAFKALDSVARLRLRDGIAGASFSIQANQEIPPFGSNGNTVRVGVGGQGKNPFLGTVSKLNIFRAPLTAWQTRQALGG